MVKGIKGFQKGYTPWNKGKTMEEAYGKETAQRLKEKFSKIAKERDSAKSLRKHIEKNGAWNKGLTKEDERVKKYCRAGFTLTKKTREKMSKSLQGRVSPNKGKMMSREQRIKISLTKTGEKEFVCFKNKLSKRIRLNGKYLEWRSNVFNRDNYTCQNCGKRGGYLEPHHIIPFSKLLFSLKITNLSKAIKCKPLWDIGNGITYCRPCHILLDKNIGRGLIVARQ